MNIYVAGKWENREIVAAIMHELRELGYNITHDWTQQEVKNFDNYTLGEWEDYAISDTDGIFTADMLIAYLENEEEYKCASPNRYCEITMAIGAGIPVIILGEPRPDFLFQHVPGIIKIRSMDGLLKYLKMVDN